MRTRILSYTLAALATVAARAHAQTPYLVKDIDPGGGSEVRVVGAVGDRLVFTATPGGPGSRAGLWVTSGTDESTLPIRDGLVLDPGTKLELDGALVAAAPDGAWRTDGTAGGTERISGHAPLPSYAGAAEGGYGVYFTSTLLPFVTDGTPAGTSRVPSPAGLPTGLGFPRPRTIDAFQGGFAFSLYVGGNPSDIWLYDPDSGRTTRLASSGSIEYGTLRAAGERLFVQCAGSGLCVTDGTASGLRQVASVEVWPSSTIETMDGIAYVQVVEGAERRLWRSDGTAGGTQPLSAIAPVTAGLTPIALAASNSVLYFAATRPDTGSELWRTDGTASGTFLLKDIDPGPGSGLPTDTSCQTPTVPLCAISLLPAAGGLLFWAGTPATGYELWRTDGTSAGTVPLPEIAPGPASAQGGPLQRAGGRAYASANDGVHGLELWAVDLTAGVVAVDDAVVAEAAGPTTVRFAVRLESPADRAIAVSYSTVAGTAVAGADFLPSSGTLTFAPGTREAFVDVAIVGDTVDEPAESFELAVTTVTGALVGDARGTAVVLDDDGARIAVADASVPEGDTGTAEAVFPATLTTGDGQATAHPVTLRAGVVLGTAGDEDFPPQPGFPLPPAPSVTFPTGTPSGTTLSLRVPVQGDTLDEPNETFSLALDAGNDAMLPEPGSITGVIVDDDGIAAAPPVEISHGSRVWTDLAPPAGRTSDVDFYALRHDLHSSYEIVVDAVSGDAMPIVVERVLADGGVFQTALPTGTGNSVAMRFFGLGVSTDHIRVRSAACGTACGPDDVYRLRMYETTLRSPRVNTVGGQSTALVVQNTTGATIAAVASYWSAGGVMSSVHAFDVPAHGTAVVDVASVLFQFSGSVTIGHNGPYAGLAGKVVSVDPAAGFAFESPLTSRPR
jgi:ELWxxDGT repeat protein